MSPEEEELPVDLAKLEIAPQLPQIKILDQPPILFNPFYSEILKDSVGEATSSTIIEGGGQFTQQKSLLNCRKCRIRRRSESVLDKLKAVIPTETNNTQGVKRLPMKKHALTTGRSVPKFILREPVLRALKTCFRHNSVRRKTLNNNPANTSIVTTHTNNINEISATGQTCTKLPDFRDLIDECEILLREDVHFSGCLNQSKSNDQISGKFINLREPIVKITNQHHSKPNSQIKTSNNNSIIPSSEYCTVTSRANISCSQQAGNGATSNTDDVTIDELASYFDTFVHIPKKMSTMAEMMYM